MRIALEELAVREMVARWRVGADGRRRRCRGRCVARSGATTGERNGQEPAEGDGPDPSEGDGQQRGEMGSDHSSTAAHELINVDEVGVGREIEMGFSLNPLEAEVPPTSPTSEKAPGVNPVVT